MSEADVSDGAIPTISPPNATAGAVDAAAAASVPPAEETVTVGTMKWASAPAPAAGSKRRGRPPKAARTQAQESTDAVDPPSTDAKTDAVDPDVADAAKVSVSTHTTSGGDWDWVQSVRLVAELVGAIESTPGDPTASALAGRAAQALRDICDTAVARSS